MKKSSRVILLIISALVFTMVFDFGFTSCKKKVEEEPEPTTPVNITSPDPGPGGTLPESVLPSVLLDSVTAYFHIYSGATPPAIDGQFVSRPHRKLYSTYVYDTLDEFYDRYVAFFGSNEYVDFYGKQWDDSIKKQDGTYGDWYTEVYRKLHVIGTGDKFTCYYITEAYPNAMYAKQSTIFSGRWDESYGGLRDFQVAVVLLETSGNTHLPPVNTIRIIGDGDGLAQDTLWMGSKGFFLDDATMQSNDPSRMFRMK